jgi:hypothetical protein
MLVTALVVSCLVSSCGALFSSRFQKVRFTSSTPGSKIVFDNTELKRSSKVRVDKTKGIYTASAEKEGFKKRNHPFELGKLARTTPFTVLNFAIIGVGPFFFIPYDLKDAKMHVFPRTQNIPELIPYEKKKPEEKYMFVHTTSIDAKSKDIVIRYYKGLQRFNENSLGTNVKSGKIVSEDIKVDNTIFTDALNYSLLKMDFIDTSRTLFPNVGNSLYLNAKVEKIIFHNVQSRYKSLFAPETPNSLLCMELTIEWELLDYYKQPIYTTKTRKRSDFFMMASRDEVIDGIKESFEDNLEYALLDIRKEIAAKGFLKKTGAKDDTSADITIDRPLALSGKRVNDYIKSSVTVKVDDGHGSGVIVSDSGHILTNFHVVAGSKTIEAMFSDDTTKFKAEVVRVNPAADLALLRVKRGNLQPLLISESDDPEIGIDVWTIGTPKSLELGQSVSKGVISGIRKKNDLEYLQTDMSLNSGNSGGPLINKDGLLLGIISSKLVGVGTEGVGFAIASHEIFKALHLKYK